MRSHFTYLILLSACLFGCTGKKEFKPLGDDALLGSWKLVKYIDHQQGRSEWETYPDDYVYQKHLTPTHFTWVKYKKSSDELEGIGGGTYDFESNTYTEDIKFFLPAGSSELGQTIPFEVQIDEDGLWHHNGYAKQFEFDVDAGEMSVVDSVKIEEVWKKISPDANESALMGTWNLESYRAQEMDSLRSEYPPFVGYMKLITPSHFVWIKYSTEGDEVMAAASGTYSYQSEVYVENIETCYPKGEGIVGTSAEFDAELDPNHWKHTGQVYKLDSTGGEPSTLFIDEVWSKILE